jgi:hypothetical protein
MNYWYNNKKEENELKIIKDANLFKLMTDKIDEYHTEECVQSKTNIKPKPYTFIDSIKDFIKPEDVTKYQTKNTNFKECYKLREMYDRKYKSRYDNYIIPECYGEFIKEYII